MAASARVVRASRGSALRARSWQTEAPLRMLMNNLDPEVAERPQDLVVYGGTGRAARSWEDYDAIVSALESLREDETLCVQSGRAAGVYRTHPMAPRVLISNAMLVPAWATPENFRALEAQGLTMFGQMTAGSWIYIGTQGILQGTYETFIAAGRAHFGGSLEGRWILTAGLGGMGGAQPLAATLAGGCLLGVEVDPERIERRLATRYLDRSTSSLDEALQWIDEARRRKAPLSVGLVGNAAVVFPEIARRGIVPDIVTDQTSAHDELHGYVPPGMALDEVRTLRRQDPARVIRLAFEGMAAQVRAILALKRAGSIAFDYGNNLRGQAKKAGVADAFDYPGFVPAYVRPLFCEGRGPFRWAVLSGDAKDLAETDDLLLETFPKNEALCRWIRLARDRVALQGLPARICWLGLGERARFGLRLNELVRRGKVSAPIVIGRDHLDCGSVASPYRETEGMKDGSDAIADWPILNALLNCASGATWVSVHHGGGVGIGNSIHAGMVVCADGTRDSDARLERVLTNDPAIGVVRHAQAGYPEAAETARREGLVW